MRTCALCGNECDASIGMYRELRTEYWGGRKGRSVEYSPKMVSFFCSEAHRNESEATGRVAGEVYTRQEIDDE